MPYANPVKAKEYYSNRQKERAKDPVWRKKRNERSRLYRLANKDRCRNAQIKCQFGITLNDVNRMLADQNNCCAICKNIFTKTPHIDHVHGEGKGKVRGLLCLSCNTGLGNFKDNIDFMASAVDYLLAAKGDDMSDKKIYNSVSSALGGKEEKPPKRLKEIRTRKTKNGGHIHEHHFDRPEHHPMEEHSTNGDDEMVHHLMANMGEPNPGEAEADAGQSGIPEGAEAAPVAAPQGAM